MTRPRVEEFEVAIGESQVMIDKSMTVRRDKLGPVVGSLESEVMVEVERRLAIFLGIAK